MKQVVCFFVSLSLIVLCSVQHGFAFSTKAESAILVDYQSGEVIFEKNADKLMPPSSMLKLMTLYMLFEKIQNGEIKLTDEMEVSKNADFNNKKFYTASKICLEKGQKLNVLDAILGIIVVSGGDASVVVAEHISKSEAQFAKDMIKKAREIGLVQSSFGNATGLPDSNNLMTVRELARLSEIIIRNFPDLYKYFSSRGFEYQHYQNDWCKKWGENHTSNYNKLLYISPSADGLKTGHTDKGGYGVATSALRKNRRLIAVINGVRVNDHFALAREAKNLLDYGYTETVNKKYISANDTILKIPTWYGNKDFVEATVAEDIVVTSNLNAKDDIKIDVRYNAYIPAPIYPGDKIGTVYVKRNNEIIKQFSLISKTRVHKLWFVGKIFRNLNLFLTGVKNA